MDHNTTKVSETPDDDPRNQAHFVFKLYHGPYDDPVHVVEYTVKGLALRSNQDIIHELVEAFKPYPNDYMKFVIEVGGSVVVQKEYTAYTEFDEKSTERVLLSWIGTIIKEWRSYNE